MRDVVARGEQHATAARPAGVHRELPIPLGRVGSDDALADRTAQRDRAGNAQRGRRAARELGRPSGLRRVVFHARQAPREHAPSSDEAGSGLTTPRFFARSWPVSAHDREDRRSSDANANAIHAVVVASDERNRRDSIEANVWPEASRMSSALFGTSDRMRIGSAGRM